MAEQKYYNSTYSKQESSTYNRGSYHLADNPTLYEVQRSNTFEFIVTGINDLLKAGATGRETSSKISNGEEVFRISVESAPIPHFTQNVLEIRRGNSVMKFAGTPSFEGGTLTFNDYIGADTKAVLMAWQNLSYNVKTENVGLMSDYKKTATLIEYSPDYKKVREWTLYGCWISGMSEDAYNQESGEKHKIQCTIQYDKAIPVID